MTFSNMRVIEMHEINFFGNLSKSACEFQTSFSGLYVSSRRDCFVCQRDSFGLYLDSSSTKHNFWDEMSWLNQNFEI